MEKAFEHKGFLIGCGLMAGVYLLMTQKLRNLMKQEQATLLAIKQEIERKNLAAIQKTQLQKNNSSKSPEQKSQSVQTEKKFFKICLTGGPCGGKTLGLKYLAKKLKERGYMVLVVPEAASLIMEGGGLINIISYSDQGIMAFQQNLMQMQISLEDRFEQISQIEGKPDQKCVILCDRGLMDGKAYMSTRLWEAMLSDYNLDEKFVRDKRYDAVIHMVSAADGAEKHYNFGNVARHEGIRDAKIQDLKSQKAWLGHPNHVIIDNKSVSSFEKKLELLLAKTIQNLEARKIGSDTKPPSKVAAQARTLSQVAIVKTTADQHSEADQTTRDQSFIHEGEWQESWRLQDSETDRKYVSQQQYKLVDVTVTNFDNNLQMRKQSEQLDESGRKTSGQDQFEQQKPTQATDDDNQEEQKQMAQS